VALAANVLSIVAVAAVSTSFFGWEIRQPFGRQGQHAQATRCTRGIEVPSPLLAASGAVRAHGRRSPIMFGSSTPIAVTTEAV
jgi:hypothetical protein